MAQESNLVFLLPKPVQSGGEDGGTVTPQTDLAIILQISSDTTETSLSEAANPDEGANSSEWVFKMRKYAGLPKSDTPIRVL